MRSLLSQFITEIVGKRKNSRTLYHIGKRPVQPKPWKYDIDEPGMIWLSNNPMSIRNNHGIKGNVYAYQIDESVIKECGGMYRYDKGTEITIPSDKWDRYVHEGRIKFLGMSMSAHKAQEKYAEWDNDSRETKISDQRNQLYRKNYPVNDLQQSLKSLRAAGKAAATDPAHAKNAVKLLSTKEIKAKIEMIEKGDELFRWPRAKQHRYVDQFDFWTYEWETLLSVLKAEFLKREG